MHAAHQVPSFIACTSYRVRLGHGTDTHVTRLQPTAAASHAHNQPPPSLARNPICCPSPVCICPPATVSHLVHSPVRARICLASISHGRTHTRLRLSCRCPSPSLVRKFATASHMDAPLPPFPIALPRAPPLLYPPSGALMLPPMALTTLAHMHAHLLLLCMPVPQSTMHSASCAYFAQWHTF
ncbi:hypothetical protein EVG20_g8947 [Dentipellis fragilis]|uniref:Uncharacterized protein n=1 Tax=Dentipellis fragilis TaxID=205917 RepID=A0A4Y9Y6D8_9AGAM|nr:hypothetical protein EVG20_g8947 [Dentipellis fragilis]